MNKKLSRAFSAFAVFVLVWCTALPVSPSAQAAEPTASHTAVPDSLIANASFEAPLASSWIGWGNDGLISVTDQVYGGDRALKVASGGQQFVQLKAGKTYSLSAHGKIAGGEGATGKVIMYYKLQGEANPSDRELLEFNSADTEYVQKEIRFTAPVNLDEEYYTMQVKLYSQNADAFYLDDLELKEISTGPAPAPAPVSDSIVTNAGFERNLADWSPYDETKFTITTDAENIYSGTKALQVEQGTGGHQAVALKPDTTYTLSAHGKVVGGGGTNILIQYATVSSPAIEQRHVLGFYDTDSSYTAKFLTFKTAADMIAAPNQVFLVIYNYGAPSFYADDLTLTEVPATPEPSSQARLNSLQIDGTTVAGFNPDINSYYTDLPYGSTAIPQVAATSAEGTVEIVNADALPGTTEIRVTGENHSVNRYYVRFSVLGQRLFNEDFESTVINEEPNFPDGWHNLGKGAYTVADIGGSKVFRLKHTENGSGGVSRSFEPQTGILTLQFKMKNTDVSTYPSLHLMDSATGQTALNVAEAWGYKYNLTNIDNTESGVTLPNAQIDVSRWRSYKLVVDIPNQKYDLYLSGVQSDPIVIKNIPFMNPVSQLDTLVIKHTSWALTGETYVDDLSLEQAPSSPNHIANGDFSNGLTHWAVTGDSAGLSNDFGRGKITVPAGTGAVKLSLSGAAVANGKDYSLIFTLRGSATKDVNVQVYSNAGADGKLIAANTIAVAGQSRVYTIPFTPDDALNPQDTAIVFSVPEGGEAWTGYIDSVFLLPAGAVIPDPQPVEYFVLEDVAVTDGLTLTGLPYDVLPQFKQIQVTFINETIYSHPVTYMAELYNGQQERVQTVSYTTESTPFDKNSFTAGFLLPDGASGYTVKLFVADSATQSLYSPVVEQAL